MHQYSILDSIIPRGRRVPQPETYVIFDLNSPRAYLSFSHSAFSIVWFHFTWFHLIPVVMGVFDRLFFTWINKIVSNAREGKLSEENMPLPEDQEAERNFSIFQKEWEAESSSKDEEKSLVKVLRKVYGNEFMLGGVFKLFWSFFVIMGAFFFVRSLLLYVDPQKISNYDSDRAGYLLMAFFFVDAYLLGLSLQRMTDICLRVGIKMRAALVSSVAKKAFTMASVKKELSADIVSFVASDIHKIYDGIQQLHYLWTAPIEAITILSLLCSLTKQYALPGFGIVGVIVPLQYLFGYLTARYKYGNAANVGARVALAQEVLPAMKLVKYYCWERFFVEELNSIRKREYGTQWKLLFVRAINIAIVFTTPPLTAFTIFTAYEFAVGKLTSDLAFTTLSLFNIMRFPLVVLPKAIRSASEAWASLTRVQEFLLLPIEHHENKTPSSNSVGVSINDGTFSYADSHDNFKMHIPKFEVRAGEVVGIAGRVGSGKTSIVNALLGHAVCERGSVSVGGSIGYVRQNPWIQNMAIRDNILFGEQYDEKRYNQVIHACALELDFQILANGDLSKAGLRGINLSGGQRQRLNIARAAYSDADIMLLDSPLSAVDYHTSHHIFKHCIKQLFRSKAVILVTHSLDLLPQCDKIAIMDGGRMVYFGPFSMAAINRYLPSPANSLLEEASKMADGVEATSEKSRKSSNIQRQSTLSSARLESMQGVTIPGEERSGFTGFRLEMFVSMRVFWWYGGLIIGCLSLVLYCLAQSTRQMSDYWIRQWVRDTLSLYKDKGKDHASRTYAFTYMALMFGFGFFNFARGCFFFFWTKEASNNLFTKYVKRTFGAPLAFFLNNPVGDLINVFSKDQDIIDENLPEALHFTGIYGLILLATVVTVSIVIKYFSCFGAALIVVSLYMLSVYLPPATQLKLLTAESNGALTGLVSEALEGLDVIQAYKKQGYFIHESEKRLNSYHKFFFNSECLNLWLAVYCDFFGAVLVLGVSMFAVFMKDEYKPADVGLAFSNVIQMLVFYTWVIRFLADTISYWGSMERITGLATTTPKETDLSPALQPGTHGAITVTVNPDNWKPTKGVVRFENVWMRYKHSLPWALKGVSFEFKPTEKIGVVGRTGSGKSTLLLALYRMFELGGGQVIYDGVDISMLSREKLRKSLSIIPQEPLMFSGTVRANLDPYNEHKDDELWTVLKEVGLKQQVDSMEGNLEAYVDGTTSEWSLGQKQLMCLARAALTDVPVLCLDEATAAMDPQTEVLVLKTIDDLFKSRTTITIAHRLDVVIESDRILVLEQGEVMELDTPDNLLSNSESMFSLLVDRSGPTQAAALRHVAREVAISKGLRRA